MAPNAHFPNFRQGIQRNIIGLKYAKTPSSLESKNKEYGLPDVYVYAVNK